MSNPPSTSLRLDYWAPRVMLVGVAAAGLLGAAAYAAAQALSGHEAGRVAVIGIAIALLGGQAANIPSLAALGQTPGAFAMAGLLNICIRCALTLGLALAARAALPIDGDGLLLWVAVGQAAMLVIDCFWLIRMSRAVNAHAVALGGSAAAAAGMQAQARS